MPEDAERAARKAETRTRLLAARRAVPAPVRAREAAELTRIALGALGAFGVSPGDTVCGYLPVGTEPGSAALLDGLRAAGCRVLLPVVVGAAPLDWAEYTGPDGLRPGPHGLREPSGATLGPSSVGLAALVLVPALAVDRAGVRLGRGGGHYDRSLPLARPDTPLVAVVRSAELVAELPAEPHDVRMTAALTPSGLHALGRPR
ncbi:5-formyltetrahydrofolate cyclo-ligase [Solihabitans fulvus]|uniref:5-formyltetrahydrofolate cyclo-ligase n=1 Tax=Solihabitans fulvus TaxID=1892852 RepID=A0A5B2WJX6_9PSEU|nr:5-formyltetrahydrofolate cyclo-ligase [Solihabitans fulvus]